MTHFVNSQIISLDSSNKSLYCEVIEVINDRNICWVRPIILVDLSTQNNSYYLQKDNIYDLRFTCDLLWKTESFRIVLDTEYIQFLVNLQDFEFDEDNLIIAKQKLSLFIQEICQNN